MKPCQSEVKNEIELKRNKVIIKHIKLICAYNTSLAFLYIYIKKTGFLANLNIEYLHNLLLTPRSLAANANTVNENH